MIEQNSSGRQMAGSQMSRFTEIVRLRDDAGGHARLRVGLVLLGILVILAFAASTAYDARRSYRHAVLSTDRELESLASALSEQTAWSWQWTDALQQDIAHWYPEHAAWPPGQIDRFLAGRAAGIPQVRSIRIIDAQGILRYSSNDLDRRDIDVSDRSYFRAQKERTARGLFISEPLITRSEGRAAVLLSRRLEDRRGEFAGVVSALVALDDLSRLYAAVNLKGKIAVELLRDDGTLLVRTPAEPALVGRSFPALVALRPDDAVRIRSPLDGEQVFAAAVRVRSMPLVVVVTRNEEAAMSSSYQEAMHGAVRTLLVALLGVLTIVVLLRQLRRIEQGERALRQAQKMEAVGTLAGGIAHDFNNILGAIVGYGELAQQQAPEGSALRRYLDNIMQAGGRARALVDRILGFSRTGITEQVAVHIQSVVGETLELLRASLPPQIRLVQELSAPDAAVTGDETRLHQVTMNLCTNALQAMPQGGELRVALEPVRLATPVTLSRGRLAAGDYVRLTVSDSGSGIAPAIADRIFDPFFTTKRVGEGTGLGLSLVHGIVADLGGVIEVSSAVGRGTTFRIWLPRSSEAVTPRVREARDPRRGARQTVMVVDDESALLALTQEMLAGLGYQAVGFASSIAALRAFQSEPARFDVVVTDEVMPDLLGTQLARELRTLRPAVPIILVSGHGGADLAERAAAAGVSDVLRKPLQRRELADSLAKVLSTQAA
jgi:signal transduction histidine kinase/ActR/RegA family two-component response regulator